MTQLPEERRPVLTARLALGAGAMIKLPDSRSAD